MNLGGACMPLGLWMIVLVVALVILLWLYNAWPEWALYRIGRELGVSHVKLTDPDIAARCAVIDSALRVHFLGACWAGHALITKVIPTVSDQISLNMRLSKLVRENREGVTQDGIKALLECIQKLQHPAIAADHTDTYRKLEARVLHVRSALRQLKRMKC